jgi:hypothetical protein
LIDELSAAAVKEIETAAGEAAKAAFLAGLDREAKSLAEIERLQNQNEVLNKSNVRKLFFTGLACFVSGVLISGGIMAAVGGSER